MKKPNSSRFILFAVAVCFACVTLSPCGATVYGFDLPQFVQSNDQVVRDDDQQEELEEEEFEEEEFEEEGEFLGELLELRESLNEHLKELEKEKDVVKERLADVNQLLDVMRQARRIEAALEKAEREDDDAAATKLATKLQEFERQIAFRGEMIELSFELREIRDGIEGAIDDGDRERAKLLRQLEMGLEEISSLAKRSFDMDASDPRVAILEAQKAKVYTNRIEKVHRALEYLEELEEAEEEDDEGWIKEIEEKLQVLWRDIQRNDREKERDSAESRESVEPQIQPVLVSDETLAPYVNADLVRDVVPLLKRHCFECHSNDESAGRLNFEKLLAATPIVSRREMWINVIEQTKNHVMPPEDAEPLGIQERRRIVLSLHNAIYRFDYSGIDDPGYEPARRLTHREYHNTIRDLFDTEIDVVDRFPNDLTGTSGFDNSANSLFIQPLLMERYLSVAEYAVESALPDRIDSERHRRARERVLVARPSTSISVREAANQVMQSFLLRAYRRPPTRAEVDRFTALIEGRVAAGASFDKAVKASLQAVLISPSFLLMTEVNQPKRTTAYPVGDWELASRLSYFLWASMPDDELFELARRGSLHDDAALAHQVERMLGDSKSEALGKVFASQWLGSEHLGKRVRLDPIDNPWCTETLMDAMRDETSMFFHYLVRENRPITELVDADYTFVNEELARLYRLDGIKGDEMRRVQLETDRRGGIFGHGSLLAVTSFPGRTSPVVRGKWILGTVLGTPPPPPPPNVSELSEEIERREQLSFREKLELHRTKPNCYACHSQMDPLGFSLENYDWFGRYRSRRGRGRINASGQLPNGTEFRGLPGLKKVIAEQRRSDLVRQLTRKLLSYALGRQLEYYDEPAIRSISERAGGDDARAGTLVREVVMSYPFRFKRNRDHSSASDVGTD